MAVAALPDGRRALFACADKTLKLGTSKPGIRSPPSRPIPRRRRGERLLRCRLARSQAPYFTALDVTSRVAPLGLDAATQSTTFA
jgi:hypothetical protein